MRRSEIKTADLVEAVNGSVDEPLLDDSGRFIREPSIIEIQLLDLLVGGPSFGFNDIWDAFLEDCTGQNLDDAEESECHAE